MTLQEFSDVAPILSYILQEQQYPKTKGVKCIDALGQYWYIGRPDLANRKILSIYDKDGDVYVVI